MKKIILLFSVMALFAISSLPANATRACITNTINGSVLEKVSCYYRVDTGTQIMLVPAAGANLTIGACYRLEYYICSIACGNGAITSAQLSPCQ